MELSKDCIPGTCSMFEVIGINGHNDRWVGYPAGITSEALLKSVITKAIERGSVGALIANITDNRTDKILREAGFKLVGEYWGNSSANVRTYLFIIKPAK